MTKTNTYLTYYTQSIKQKDVHKNEGTRHFPHLLHMIILKFTT